MIGLIPLNNKVTIIRSSGLDAWGLPIKDSNSQTTYPARVDYNSSNNPTNGARGTEEVITAKIILEGLVDIRYEDTIEFKDKLGNVAQYKPLKINVREDLGGNPLYTVVEV